MSKGIHLNSLATEYKLKIIGNSDVLILYPGSLNRQDKNSLLWVKNSRNLDTVQLGCVLINSESVPEAINKNITYLVTQCKPRLIFAKIVNKYFSSEDDVFINFVEEHKKNSNIRIGDYVFIGQGVEIGDGTIIHPNVVIHSKTKIGKNCVVKTHVSIGTEGLGLELDVETNEFVKFPQLGGVIIHDNVEIGPCSTIRRSALDDTIIMSGTKIGSMVNIGHNCIIGKNCILTCHIVTSGSSVIGDNVFMGVNSSVKNGVNIGSNVTIGQGAVVTKSVPENSTFVGNPAEDIIEYKLWSKLKKHLMSTFGGNI